jgi:membrane protein
MMQHDPKRDWSYDDGRGRDATRPGAIPWAGWKDVLWRTKDKITQDRLSLIAAGVTFYLLLAIFPALAALVSVYGLIADPATIQQHVSALAGLLPEAGVDILQNQLQQLIEQSGAALGFGFVFGLLVALWSANNGVKALFEGMNVVYGEEEKRSFVWLNLVSLTFTVGAIVLAILFMIAIAVVPLVLQVVGLGQALDMLIRLLRWPVLLVVAAMALAILNRYGASRSPAKWPWLMWGSGITAIVWLVTAIAFSWYLSNFANYNATYGSLGAVIGFLMWMWVSVFVLLIGSELNSEIEHQTAEDTTAGPDRPLGQRGAHHVADSVGNAVT